MAKNLCAKTRDVDNPYLTLYAARTGWTWRLLKSWQGDPEKPYGRIFCQVDSPFTHGLPDMGDTYVSDIVMGAANGFAQITQFADDVFDSPEQAAIALLGRTFPIAFELQHHPFVRQYEVN